MRKNLLLLIGALGALTLAACQQEPINEKALNAPMIADFSKGESEEVFASNGWSNGQPFNAVWTSDNVNYSDGKMKLSIKDKEAEADGVKYPHTAGEARTHKLYGYGDFEVRMKPSNVVGSVSTFFTYTDKWNKVNGVENKHDEIDIEFLGKDTTKVQFNYFVGGQGNHEHMHDLGFDASQGFHNYGFRWTDKSITWFVDGTPVYQVKKDNASELPSQNGRMMCSYWPSSLDSWSGTYKGPSDKTCDYEWIKSSGNAIYADGEEPVIPPEPGHEDDPVALTFWASDETSYVLTQPEDNMSANVAYTDLAADSYACVGSDLSAFTNLEDVTAFRVKLENKGSENAKVRVDVKGTTQVGNHAVINTSASAPGHTEVWTDLEWGGSYITLAAGETVEFLINIDQDTERGALKEITFFIDSANYGDSTTRTGEVALSEFTFFRGSEEDPDDPADPEDPVDPPASSSTSEPETSPSDPASTSEAPYYDDTVVVPAITSDAEELTFWASDANKITLASGDSNKSVSVTYKNLAGNSYACLGTETLEGVENLTSVDTVRVTITNKGLAAAKARVDVKGTTKVGNHQCINVSATATGHTDIYTDTEWGGSSLTLAAGESVTFVIKIDQSTSRGTLDQIALFVDSFQGDSTLRSGKVVFSSFEFVVSEPAPGPESSSSAAPEPDSSSAAPEQTSSAEPQQTSSSEPEQTSSSEPQQTSSAEPEQTSSTTPAETSSAEPEQTSSAEPAESSSSEASSGSSEAPVPTGLQLTFDGSLTSYGLTSPACTNVTTVTAHYENLAANSYANLNANVSGVEGLSDYNFFKVTLKNNGSSLAKVRIDTKSGSTHIHTNVVSIGDWGAWTEAEGTIVQLGAGTTATIGITFDQASGDKPLDTIFFFIDSATHDDSSLKTGEVVISDYEFSTVYDWSKATSVDATFNSDSSMYEISKTAGVTTIAYTNAAGYVNASSCVNWVEGTHNSVQLRIRNTGSSNASIRIDLIDEDWGTPITAQANVFERPDIVTNANNETTVTLGSQQMMDVTINYTGNLQFIVLYVNSMQGAPAENSGSVAIEVVKLGNIA